MITPFQNFTKDQVVWTSLRSKTATHWNRGSIPPSPCFCSSRSLSNPGRFHFKSNYIGKVNSCQFQWISKVHIYAVWHPQIAPKALKWILTRNISVLTMLLKPTSRKTKMSVFAKLMLTANKTLSPPDLVHTTVCTASGLWGSNRFTQVHCLVPEWIGLMDSDGVQVHIKRKNITCRKCVNMCEHTLYHSPHALCVMRFNFQPTVKPTSTRLKTPRMILLNVKSWQPPRKTRMIVEMNQFLHWPHATYQRIAPQYRNCPDVACQPSAGTSRVGYLYAVCWTSLNLMPMT